jgi:TRAP transporter TAXI family solute receptor
MKRTKIGYRIMIVIAAILLIGAASVTGSEAQSRRISIGTADTGGVYYILGGGIAKVISANVPNTIATAEVTPGAVDNVKMLQNDSVDFAFTKSDIAAEGIKGIGPFAATGKVPVRVIAVLYPDIAHVIVTPGINGKRISTSAPGSGHEMVAGKLLEAAGVDPLKDFKRERVSLSESANAFKDRKIDGFFFATGLPAASMLDINATAGLSYQVMDVQSYLPTIAKKHGRIYSEAIIPKGTYSKIDHDVKTIGVPVIFVTTEKMDEKLVYAITKNLFEKKADLVAVHKQANNITLKNATNLADIPFHPGAIRYYKEQGAMK